MKDRVRRISRKLTAEELAIIARICPIVVVKKRWIIRW
jgi:hypothetical protein